MGEISFVLTVNDYEKFRMLDSSQDLHHVMFYLKMHPNYQSVDWSGCNWDAAEYLSRNIWHLTRKALVSLKPLTAVSSIPGPR
jgi:hypothetical protein